ncbi:MAG: hypothetical protein QNJ62_06535 [Methyloceanibacter sp.]|nr:hypothetical protein [Methyloceanibacter sp.]
MNRAEQILETVKTKLATVAILDNRVYRSQARQNAASDLPAAIVKTGNEEILEAHTPDELTVGLTVFVQLKVSVYPEERSQAPDSEETEVETALYELRSLAENALVADHTLGIAFVQNFEWVSADEVEPSSDAETAIAVQQLEYLCTYFRKRADPEN